MAEQVIPFSLPFSQQQIECAFFPLLRQAVLQVREVFSGNINVILKVENGDQTYGVRVRLHESIYRYEPDLMKEVFILRLLQQAGKAPNDALVAEAFRRLREAQRGTVSERCDGAPTVRYFDWSRQLLPHPYCIYDWVDGTPLVDCPTPELYTQAGRALARIHQVQFSAFYADFLSIGVAPVSWSERYRAALAKERAAAIPYLPHPVGAALDSMRIPVETPCAPCLVHNDFAPGNILVKDAQIAAVIDWDNAVIEAPHLNQITKHLYTSSLTMSKSPLAPLFQRGGLNTPFRKGGRAQRGGISVRDCANVICFDLDFVKMKYWTARNAAHELAHNAEFFAAFVDGYGTTGREIINSSLFTLYEILWLLRVFNFERSKEARGLVRAPGYPAAGEYEKLLAHLLRMAD
jgi:aminoglycoside phosphotransferase (APT) family kinase protein